MRLISSQQFPMRGTQPNNPYAMKTNRIHLLLVLAATVTASAEVPRPPLDRRPPPQPLLRVLDASQDGELSAAEIANSSAALGELDKNADGILSPREILPPPPKKTGNQPPQPPKGPPHPLLRALDLNNDRSLSAAEITAAPTSLATLDLNTDGTISRAELSPGKPPRKADT